MCQDDDRIDALIAQNLFIMSNGFGFIKNLIIFIVVVKCQNWQISCFNTNKADFNNLVITSMDFLDDVRLETIWNLAIIIIGLGALENHICRNDINVGGFAWVGHFGVIILLGWLTTGNDPVKFAQFLVKFMITQRAILNMHCLECMHGGFILQKCRVGWRGADHVTSFNTNRCPVWIGRLKVSLSLIQRASQSFCRPRILIGLIANLSGTGIGKPTMKIIDPQNLNRYVSLIFGRIRPISSLSRLTDRIRIGNHLNGTGLTNRRCRSCIISIDRHCRHR